MTRSTIFSHFVDARLQAKYTFRRTHPSDAMAFVRRFLCCLLLITPFAYGPQARAAGEVIDLRLPTLSSGRHVYYVKLLEESLKAAGYVPRITLIDPMPQPRIWHALAAGQISAVWGVQTETRDRDFPSIANALTSGIIAQRVFVIHAGTESAYADVNTLADLRATGKIGGVGEGWYDAELWQFNRLPVLIKSGDWQAMYRMVGNGDRNVDYVVRGVNEAVDEISALPGLVIEPNLVLVHDRDMRFYLSPANAALAPIIEDALARADRNGLKRRLIAQYILPTLAPLKLDKRRRLLLTPPASASQR
ncbi:substrate-binding periplasmic protein [Uliginosibacterium sp. sgz301328]|uniref:substrate-binding periplasmic protein n=1 Tax=Uliginosibacterium sp. sgz301328 TaxID=3243764 RepID=UPI00359D3ADD